MNRLAELARHVQGLGNLLPARWRLPVRYFVQRLTGGLEPEFALLPSIVPRERLALDIGANMGVYSYALASLVPKVHAFEPQAGCCAVIGAWARASGQDVEVHHAGVGSSAGELVLHVPLHGGRQVGTRASFTQIRGPHVDMRVPVVTIDSLQLGPVGFAKIDVEGFEYDVLLGAQCTLQRDRPALLIEMDRNRHERETFDRIVDLLATMGYVPHVLRDGRLEACREAPWDMAARYYNFVFLQHGESR